MKIKLYKYTVSRTQYNSSCFLYVHIDCSSIHKFCPPTLWCMTTLRVLQVSITAHKSWVCHFIHNIYLCYIYVFTIYIIHTLFITLYLGVVYNLLIITPTPLPLPDSGTCIYIVSPPLHYPPPFTWMWYIPPHPLNHTPLPLTWLGYIISYVDT